MTTIHPWYGDTTNYGKDCRGGDFFRYIDGYGRIWYWSKKDQCWNSFNKGDGIDPLPFPPEQAEKYQKWIETHGPKCHDKCDCMINPFVPLFLG